MLGTNLVVDNINVHNEIDLNDPNTKIRYLELGDAAYKKDDLPIAVTNWKLSAMAGCGLAYNRLGLYEMSIGNSSDAIKYLELAVDNGYYDALITLISCLKTWEDPDYYRYELKLLEAYQNRSIFEDMQTMCHYAGRCYYDEGAYSLAIEALTIITSDYLNYKECQLMYAECLINLFEWDKLFEFASTKTEQGETDYYFFLVEVANNKDENVAEAIEDYINRECGYAPDQILPIVSRVGKLEEYETYLDTLDKSDGFMHKCLGDIRNMDNDLEGACKLYRESLNLGHTDAIFSLIYIYKNNNMVDEANKYYSIAIEYYDMVDLQSEYDEYVNSQNT